MAATLDDIEAELHGEIFGVLGQILEVLEEGGGAGGDKGDKEDKETKATSVKAFAGQLTAAIGLLALFTTALNPGVAQAFGTALAGLAATIGQAAQPAIMVLTGVVGDIAGKISPLAQQLGPVLSQIANAIGSVLVPYIGILATVLQVVLDVLSPFIRIITDLFQVFGAIVKVGEVLLQTFVKFLAGLFGSDMQNASDRLHTAFEKLANLLLILAATLLSLLGMDDAVRNLLHNLENEGKDKGVAAAGQTGFSGFEQVAKTIAENAAKSGFGNQDKDKFNFGEAIGEINKILNGQSSYLKEIAANVNIIAHPVQGFGRATGISRRENESWWGYGGRWGLRAATLGISGIWD